MGNAAFHSGYLYPHLAPAVPLLVDLVATDGVSECKARANAAGALGNLIRHGFGLQDVLVRKLVFVCGTRTAFALISRVLLVALR